VVFADDVSWGSARGKNFSATAVRRVGHVVGEERHMCVREMSTEPSKTAEPSVSELFFDVMSSDCAKIESLALDLHFLLTRCKQACQSLSHRQRQRAMKGPLRRPRTTHHQSRSFFQMTTSKSSPSSTFPSPPAHKSPYKGGPRAGGTHTVVLQAHPSGV
jgi:hypothetical protein